MTNVVLNGNAYSDDGTSSRDMQGGGHRQWLLPMLGDATLEINAPVQGVLDAAAAADGSAIAAASSASASATSATNALNSYNAANAIGSGWTAVTVAEADGTRTVLRVTDWTGGKGTKPSTGYVGPSGLVGTAAAATNVRGAVAYADLTGRPTLGTASAMNVPVAAATAATSAQVVRGDDPRLAASATRGTQLYTTSQNIAKSTFGTAEYVFVDLWAGGGSGSAGLSASGGEGGEYVSALMRIAELSDPVALVIGAGGASVTSTTTTPTPGMDGGDSKFGSTLTAHGGLGGVGSVASVKNLAAKTGGTGGSGQVAQIPQNSVMGGGGGGGGDPTPKFTIAGLSQFGGDGGDGVRTSNAPATAFSGSIPSGGGGGASIHPNTNSSESTSGAGARGECRLTWW